VRGKKCSGVGGFCRGERVVLFLGSGKKKKTAVKTSDQEKNKKDTSNQQRSNEQSTQTQQSKILNESARLKRVARPKV
jgi:hypothetical protein